MRLSPHGGMEPAGELPARLRRWPQVFALAVEHAAEVHTAGRRRGGKERVPPLGGSGTVEAAAQACLGGFAFAVRFPPAFAATAAGCDGAALCAAFGTNRPAGRHERQSTILACPDGEAVGHGSQEIRPGERHRAMSFPWTLQPLILTGCEAQPLQAAGGQCPRQAEPSCHLQLIHGAPGILAGHGAQRGSELPAVDLLAGNLARNQ